MLEMHGLLAVLAAASVITNMTSLVSAKKNVDAGRPFRISATLLSVPVHSGMPFAVESDGVGINLYDTLTCGRDQFEIGDRVELAGMTKYGPTDLTKSYVNPDCSSARLLSRGMPPEPIELRPGEKLSERHNFRLCTIRGILTDIAADGLDPLYFCLTVSSGNIEHYVTCTAIRSRIDDFLPLRGAEVAITGVGSYSRAKTAVTDYGRHYTSPGLSIQERKALTVIRRESEAATAISDVSETDGLSCDELSDLGLIRATGRVLASWRRNRFLLQTDDERIVSVELAEDGTPACGDRVEAVGYAETDLLYITLVRATHRILDRTNADESAAADATPVVSGDLLSVHDGHVIVYPKFHGRRVRVEGIIRILPHEDGSRMQLESDSRNIPVDLSTLPDVVRNLQIGSRVQVTGVCVLKSENCRRHYAFPAIHGVFLVPNGASDVVVLERPSWWTATRLLTVIAILIGVIVVILIWNASLRLLVDKRSRALLKAEVAKISSELRIDERTRLASELHDYFAQNLTAISYELTSANRACALGSKNLGSHLAKATAMLGSCLTELRRCLWDLRSDTLDETDFPAAIRRSLEPVLGGAQLAIRFNVPRKRISDTTAHTIISVLRELTHNAIKHGQAREIRIAGEILPDFLRFSVRDNGCGFDVSGHPNSSDGHFGLDGIGERLRKHDGTITLETTPGIGTRAVVTIRTKHTKPQ